MFDLLVGITGLEINTILLIIMLFILFIIVIKLKGRRWY